jgi:hypothetical protein
MRTSRIARNRVQLASRSVDNGWDSNVVAQSNTLPPSAQAEQRKLAGRLNQYKTDGKVQVVPKKEPVPITGPTSWPPIPPAYVPRPGTIVVVPYVETAFAPDTPARQTQGKVPVIKRSSRNARPWITSNPDYIPTWNQNITSKAAHTSDAAHLSPHPTGTITYR